MLCFIFSVMTYLHHINTCYTQKRCYLYLNTNIIIILLFHYNFKVFYIFLALQKKQCIFSIWWCWICTINCFGQLWQIYFEASLL